MFTSLYINTSLHCITYDTYKNVTLFYYFDWINKAVYSFNYLPHPNNPQPTSGAFNYEQHYRPTRSIIT